MFLEMVVVVEMMVVMEVLLVVVLLGVLNSSVTTVDEVFDIHGNY